MKKKLQLIALLVASAIVITFSIRAGEHHDRCDHCSVNNLVIR